MTRAWVEDDPAVSALLDRVRGTDRLLVALDFDGTLAPLTDEPMSARATPAARSALDELIAAPDTLVAFVSGRTLGDLRVIAEHDDESPIWLAGSHGAEYWWPGGHDDDGDGRDADDAEARLLAEELRTDAEKAVAGIEGVWVEPKSFGFAVHTRLAAREDARRADDIVDRVVRARAPRWRRRTGHDIVEYAYRHEGKDVGVATLRARTQATAVLFAGDDVTDEDALASLGASDLGVRVGEADSAAALRVKNTEELARVLSIVARGRRARRE